MQKTLFYLFVGFVLSFRTMLNAATPQGLEHHSVSLAMPAVSSLNADTWYVMYNVGRKGFLYDGSSKLYISTAPPSADGQKYLVRIIEKDGKSYIETGLGRYFGSLSTSNNSGTTTTAKTSYTFGAIADGYFWLKDANGMVLDANALGTALDATSTVAGWGKDTPTSIDGNNSWKFFPVELADVDDDNSEMAYSFGQFSMRNVSNDLFLQLDTYNLGMAETEESGSLCFTGQGTWTVGVPAGTDAHPFLHIGTGGKFSAGPATPIHLYRAWPIGENEYRYTEVASVTDGAPYLVVADFEGNSYAMAGVVEQAGTSSQRILSARVTLAPDAEAGVKGEAQLLTASFSDTRAEEVYHWVMQYAESLIQDPFVYTVGETGGASGAGKPLLTIACVSDIHTQDGWLSGSDYEDKDNGIHTPLPIGSVKVRESLTEAVNALKREGVDVMIVGGDCQSDATVDEEHWRQVRRLMANSLRNVGGTSADDFPVLYVNGNHEYEVANTWGGASGAGCGYYKWRDTRPFNAGEYYEYPMMGDIAPLASGRDCYYEDCPNATAISTKTTMPVMAAYHYNIKGFDFVVLNCAKHLFHNANNYTYSDESVAWVEQKLREIYADCPDGSKTVFFALHIPFGDSNSINTSEDKGMSYIASSHRLKQVLAQYPGLVMLYGHDHGQDNAYIRKHTSQRITRYDTNGNVMATADGVNTFDKDSSIATPYTGQSAMLHPYSGKTTGCFGVKASYNVTAADPMRAMAVLDEPATCTIFPEVDGQISMRLGDGSQHFAYTNGSFRMTAADHQPLTLYHATIENDSIAVERVQKLEDGELYFLAGNNSVYRVGGTRALPKTQRYPLAAFSPFLWRAELPGESEASFISSFMGSMRYYSNSNGEPSNSSQTAARKVIQGLMVYVYEDRIVFDMKNFRNNSRSRVRNELTPFVVRRQIPAVEPEAIVKHNANGAYFRRVENIDELCDGAVCLFVDDTKNRAVGVVNNNSQKYSIQEVKRADDGNILSTRKTDDSEFVLERATAGKGSMWYLKTCDGYMKNADEKVFHRQQRTSFFTGNLLDNEAMNGQLTPWQIELDEEGVAHVTNEVLGELQKQTFGLTTGTLHLYQKVVPVEINDATGLASLYSEMPLCTHGADIEAFIIDGVQADGILQLVRHDGVIPAKTGLLVRRTKETVKMNAIDGFADVMEIPVVSGRYDLPLRNDLTGTLSTILTPTPIAADGARRTDCVFYTLDSTEGIFLPADGTGSAFVNKACSAYLVLDAGVAATYDTASSKHLDILMDGAVLNGINTAVAAKSGDGDIYNLMGQRVSTPSRPGIYVIGGKKVVIK